jgi:hypothetical protein
LWVFSFYCKISLMSLKNIEQELYKREENQTQNRQAEYSRIKPVQGEENPFAPGSFKTENVDKSAIWIKEDEEKKEKRKKIIKKILIGVGAVLILSGLVWVALVVKKSAFSEDGVKIQVSGPEQAQSGEMVTFEISYENLNRISLRDAVLYIGYSENFKPEGNLGFEGGGPNASRYNIGTIDPKKNGKVTFRGKVYGTKNIMTYLEVKLDYSSSNFSSTFESTGRAGIMITSSPLAIEIISPQNVSSGGAVTLVAKFQNNSEETFKDLKVKIEYPQDFSYSSAEPLPTRGDNIWYVGDLEGGQKSEVRVMGVINGEINEIKRLKVSLGEFSGNDQDFVAYNEAEGSIKIVGSAIAINQVINNQAEKINVNANDILTFIIKYKNTSQIPLKDVILTEEIKSPILDYEKLKMQDNQGSFDSASSKVSWNGSQVPGLKNLMPSQEGEVHFSIPVKGDIPVQSSTDKSFSFNAVAKMDSPDIPTSEGSNKIISSNEISVKLNSKLLLSETGFYNDSEIANTGPLPLQIGQETTFTMHVKTGSVSNDITNAAVVVTLAPGVKWKNNFLPKDSNVSFNDRTSELTWNIGTMPAGMGVITGQKELIFQIGVTPSQVQGTGYPLLTKKTVFTADDSFTKQKISAELGEKNSNLTEDISVGADGRVGQ